MSRYPMPSRRSGDVAQLGERLVCNQQVGGSNPLVSTSLWIPEPNGSAFRAIRLLNLAQEPRRRGDAL